MKIGLFGGSFDPIHLGHVIAGKQVLEKKLCDKIWFFPCWQNPLKKQPEKAEHRKKMIELAIQNEKNMELNEFELNKQKKTYTIDSIKELKKKFPEHEFNFIASLKAIENFHKWKKPEKLLKEIKFILVAVENKKEIPEKIKKFNPITIKPTLSSEISSTLIRKKIKQKKPVSVFLPDKVFDYIKKNKLYGFK